MTSQSGITNICNKHIVQYLVKQRQPGDEIWSFKRMSPQKYFSSKIMLNRRQGD